MADFSIPKKEPDPETAQREQELWDELLKDFASDELQNQYLGFVIKNNLLVQGSKRYGAFIQDQENNSIEMRRIAHLNQQKITKILFFVPEKTVSGEKTPQSKTELVIIFGSVLVALNALGFAAVNPKYSIIAVPLGLAALVGLGYFLYKKIKAGADKLNRSL